MEDTCIRYDESKKEITIFEYPSGRGGKWTGEPMYMIRCTCGYPLKTMFHGRMPEIIHKCEFKAYNHDESCKVHELKNHAAWGIQLERSNCPHCGACVAIGPDMLIAAEKFIRAHIMTRNYQYNSNRIRVSPKAKQALEKMAKYKNIRFSRECITNRADFSIIWRTGNEKHDYGNGDWNKWYDARQAETNNLRDALGLNADEDEETDNDPFDFSDDVINSHDEDCTCNLCQK